MTDYSGDRTSKQEAHDRERSLVSEMRLQSMGLRPEIRYEYMRIRAELTFLPLSAYSGIE
jgi:hypothetical protein